VHEDNVASHEVLRDSISDDAEGFGCPTPPVDTEVSNSTKLCEFLANLASKKQAPMSPLQTPLEEIPAIASVFVPSTVATKGIKVDPEDPVAVKHNAFLSLVFRPLPPPIIATPGPRRAHAPMEVATIPCWSCGIKKYKQKRKNAEFDDNALAAFNDKFKTPFSPRSITMLGSLVKKMEKVKRPKS
jgi:hypothetical protein